MKINYFVQFKDASILGLNKMADGRKINKKKQITRYIFFITKTG